MYCGNDPINRIDPTGRFWETIFDVVSLVVGIVDVVKNPTDAWAWIGLAGDVADVLVPFVGGIGDAVRAGRYIDKGIDAVSATSDALRSADNVYDTARAADKADDIVDVAHGMNNALNTVDSVGTIKYTDKVIKQMDNVNDLNHAFPTLIDTMIDMKVAKPLKGGDGVMRNLVELPGTLNGKKGVFEYIIEPNGYCNHRFFREIH